MHIDESIIIRERLSELFDIANDLRRRIDELAEMAAYPPVPAQVLRLRRSGNDERIVKSEHPGFEVRDVASTVGSLVTASLDSRTTET